MKEILSIINENLGPENFNNKSFTGEVYFNYENGLNIEKSVYNKLLNKYNAAFALEEGDILETEDELLLVFVNEMFVDNSSSWFEKDKNYYLSAVLVEDGLLAIYSDETDGSIEPDIIFALPWEDIDFVELFEAVNGGYIFRFYAKDGTEQDDLLSNRFGTSSLVASRKILNIFNEIIEYKKQSIALAINEHSELKSKIEKTFEEGDYNRTIEGLESFCNYYEVEDVSLENSSFYYLLKTLSLNHLEQFDEALETIERYIKNCECVDRIEPYSYEVKGRILLKKNQLLPAINYLAYSEENYEIEDYKKSARLLKEESYFKIKQAFLEIPYEERKLIFIGEEIYATKSNEIIVLKKREIPDEVYFPIGHPHVNKIYTCHPHKQNFYLPVKDYSEELFMDRINEFSYLLQCLGATKLEISSTKSNSSDQKVLSKKELDVNVDYKINSGKVNLKGVNTENTLVDGKLKIAKKQIFKPVKAPFVPTNLIWYHSDLNWQRLVDQRLNGNIMTHDEIISSSQSENISSHELKQIDAELKILLPKIGVTYNGENDIATSSKNTHEWILTVEFEDVENLQPNKNIESELLIDENNNNKEIDTNLKKYREDVLVMIEDDGIIDDMERNILNRKIKRYGISEEDALIIENEILTTDYSENELNYIQEIREFLEDGGISNIERKILDRYALKFGVDKDKQIEIDKIFIK
jgi:hypothetical protein